AFVQQSKCLFGEDVGLRFQLKKPRYDALMAQGKGVLSSALALRASAVGISEALYSFHKEIDAWLKDDLRDVAIAKIAGVSNMQKPDTHLVDAAIKMGAEIVSVNYG
ncbi:MAG: hypothetical protein KAV40_05560, partial [Thermoplasmatales archaeon]|nr:hypothetical protein [Thermoplasmatales archaeon]